MTAYYPVSAELYSKVDIALSNLKRAVRDGSSGEEDYGSLACYDYTRSHFYNGEFSRSLLSLPMLSFSQFRRVVEVVFADFDLSVTQLWLRQRGSSGKLALADHVPTELRFQLGSVFLHAGVGRLDRDFALPTEAFHDAVADVLARDKLRAFSKDQYLLPKVEELRTNVKRMFRAVPFCAYGAQITGFATCFSDYDYSVGCQESRISNTQRDLDSLADKLQALPGIVKVERRTQANVPLCRCTFAHDSTTTDYENTVEISFDNVIGLKNSGLLRLYSTFDSRVRDLGRMVKLFIRAEGIVGAQRRFLSNYAWMVMVIFFLQRCDPPVLPCLQDPLEAYRPRSAAKPASYWYYRPRVHQHVEKPTGLWSEISKDLVWRHSFPNTYRGANTDSASLLFWKFCHFYLTSFPWSCHIVDTKTLSPKLKVDTRSDVARKPGLVVACPVETNRFLVVQDGNFESMLSKLAEVCLRPVPDLVSHVLGT